MTATAGGFQAVCAVTVTEAGGGGFTDMERALGCYPGAGAGRVAEPLNKYTNVKNSSEAWWYPDMVTVYSARLIRGMTDTTLALVTRATRAQAAVIAYGLLQMLGKV